ncbi:MAG: hypothetical protein L0229_31820 [Blastocatellia bacterium]|nr:hypothetical protein [Blastocatellia bacterium]
MRIEEGTGSIRIPHSAIRNRNGQRQASLRPVKGRFASSKKCFAMLCKDAADNTEPGVIDIVRYKSKNYSVRVAAHFEPDEACGIGFLEGEIRMAGIQYENMEISLAGGTLENTSTG